MLENLSYKDFASEVKTKFRIAETDIEVELVDAKEKNNIPNQEMFTLTFSGAKDRFLEQKIYKLHHEKLGEGELFLVPISEDSESFKYEAGFNRLRN